MYSYFQNPKLELNQLPRVILIQTDSKLNIVRLFTIIVNRLLKALASAGFPNDKLTQKLVKKFAKDCLKNLTIYQAFNGEQFILALAACESFIQSILVSPTSNQIQKSTIIPIFIDSINSSFEIIDRL